MPELRTAALFRCLLKVPGFDLGAGKLYRSFADRSIQESQEDCFNQMASLGDCCKFCQHDPRFVWRIFRSSITGAFAVREILIFVLVRE